MSLTPSTKSRIETVAIASVGAALFWAMNIPLPFLFGPMAACLLAALLRRPLKGLGQVSVAARTILGVAVGSAVTPELMTQLPQMAISVALIPIYIGVIGLIGVPFFHRICGFDWATAWYASMPGGLQDMVIFGQEAGGDVRALSLIHATRVLIVVTIGPAILVFGFGATLDGPIGAPASSIPIMDMVWMVVAALVGWKGGERIGLFGASILGPMILTAVFSLSGLIHFRPPAEAILSAQFMIGLAIGVGYVGVTGAELRRSVFAGVMFAVILAVLAGAITLFVVKVGLAEPIEGFLAFAPGGQAEMTILTIVVGADLGFVIVHHITRVVFVIIGAPLAARWLMPKS